MKGTEMVVMGSFPIGRRKIGKGGSFPASRNMADILRPYLIFNQSQDFREGNDKRRRCGREKEMWKGGERERGGSEEMKGTKEERDAERGRGERFKPQSK